MSERRLRLFGRKPKMKAAEGSVSLTPPLVNLLQLLDGTAASYGSVYRKIAPVRTVVDFLSDAVATTPLKVYRRLGDSRPELRDHPLAVLLRNPNPDMTGRMLVWRTIADLAIYGNAYWRKVQVGASKSVVPLPPFRVTPQGGDLMRPGNFRFFSPNGLPPRDFSPDEIVQFKLYDPEDPRIGTSKIEAIRNILLEEVYASAYRRGMWKNNARPAAVLRHPEQLSIEAEERLSTQMENTYSGAENAGKWVILEENMDLKEFGFTSRDQEFVLGREFVLQATARAYNVPLALLSLTETATYASQREFHIQLYTDVLPPWYELVQSEIELQLLPWFTDVREVYVEFVVESKLRGDFIEQANVLNTAIGRPWMTVQEGRSVQNFPARGVTEDSELVVPVGPNYALEGMAVAAPAPLAPVTQIPVAASLTAFFDRQERSVLERMRQQDAKFFDRGRWDRELADVVGSVTMAANINLRTELALMSGADPRDVFRAARQAVPA